PVFSSGEQAKAIAAIADKAGITGLTGNFLRVVPRNRQLIPVPGMSNALRQIAAEHRGETAAEVTSAHELTAAQQTELKAALKNVGGKDVDTSASIRPPLAAW